MISQSQAHASYSYIHLPNNQNPNQINKIINCLFPAVIIMVASSAMPFKLVHHVSIVIIYFTQEINDSFTSALQRAICDKLAMCSQESDIGLRDSTITCSNPDSKFGTYTLLPWKDQTQQR